MWYNRDVRPPRNMSRAFGARFARRKFMDPILQQLRERFDSSVVVQNLIQRGLLEDVERLRIQYQLTELPRFTNRQK